MPAIPSHKIFQGDSVIWIVFFLLCMISLVEVFSAGSTLAYKSGDFMAPLVKQAVMLGLGTCVTLLFHSIPCRFFKIIPVVFLPVSIVLLVLTLLIGVSENGAGRWLTLGFFSFQPSEFAKGTVVITVALILAAMQQEKGADRRAFKYVLIVTGFVSALIVTENLSTAALLCGVVFVMMFIGRVSLIQLGKLLGFFAAVAAVVVLTVSTLPEDSKFYDLPVLHRLGTWKSRFASHGDDKVIAPKDFDLDKNGQVGHAAIAIASCNFVGKMPGNSVERDFLSQAYSDFIYAIIIEEMGVWGAVIVVFLYVVLLFRAGRIASRCERSFPAFLTMGLALLLVSQAILNMLVAVGLFPVTGQPLPLISRGGTSTLICCVYFGMILSVSRYARKNDEDVRRSPDSLSEEEKEYFNDEGLV